MKTKFILLSLAFVSALNCFGWGQKGHDVTAYIAEKHLTPTTKSKVEAALGNHSLVYFSNWLDNASHTDAYAYTKTWHYMNVDADETYETTSINPKGDVVSAIKEQISKLKKGSLKPADEELALKILIHLMGDIHQPMHMGHRSDLGGNLWPVKFFNRDTKLHTVWDGDLVESAHKWSFTEWQQQIDRGNKEIESAIEAGNVDSWGGETYKIATKVYQQTPQNTKISYDYIANAAPIIEMQFLKGGLRLAELLNSIYDPAYKK